MSSPTPNSEPEQLQNAKKPHLRPRKWRIIGCPRSCSLNEITLPGAAALQVHSWFEEGHSNNEIAIRLKAGFDYSISDSAVARHRRKHLVPEDHLVELRQRNHQKMPGYRPSDSTVLPDREKKSGKKASDLDLLDAMIAKGAETIHSPTVRVSSEQMLRAIELRYKLTQGSAFQDFFTAIGASMDESIAGPEEAPEATASEDEQAQGETVAGEL